MTCARLQASVPGTGAVANQAQVMGRTEGKVISGDSGAPLDGVIVVVEGSARMAVTDFKGEYRLDAAPAGTVRLLGRRLGYAPVRMTLGVTPRTTTRGDIVLQPTTLRLDDIVVSARREEARRTESPPPSAS